MLKLTMLIESMDWRGRQAGGRWMTEGTGAGCRYACLSVCSLSVLGCARKFRKFAGIRLRVEKRMHMESDRAKRLFILVRAAMIDILRGVETFGLAEGWITERALPDRKERREAAQEAKLKSGAP